jgi:hypothetical protein
MMGEWCKVKLPPFEDRTVIFVVNINNDAKFKCFMSLGSKVQAA